MEKLLKAINLATQIRELETTPIVSVGNKEVHVWFNYFTQQFPQFALRKRFDTSQYPYEVSTVIGGVRVFALASYDDYGYYMLGKEAQE